tara:strand:- start:871 stop:1089 length:219 start_codon:yes stop_codon:yes gene_type:complete
MTLTEAKEQIKFLQWEIKTLKDKQKEFQDELIKEVTFINTLPPFKRWWKKGKLLISICDTIIEAVEKANKSK